MGQYDGAANHLLGMLWIDGEANGEIDRLVKLGVLGLPYEGARLLDAVFPRLLYQSGDDHALLRNLRHCGHASAISIPIDLAVPITVRMAASMSVQFMYGIFCSASSRTCFMVTLPSFFLLGSFEPDPGFFVVAS